MIPVRLSAKAATDLEDIGDYIARDNRERAATFVDELQNACARIAENPKAYVTRDDLASGLRMAVHRHYLILFRILQNEIRVERIVHGARNLPYLWQN
jgi:toxin ParE1/3/4